VVKSSSSTIMYTSSWGVMYSIIASLGAGPAFLGALRWGGEAEGLRLGFVFFEGGGGLVDGFDEEEAEVEEGSRAQGSARGMICSDCPAPCCAVLYPAALCWCVGVDRAGPSVTGGGVVSYHTSTRSLRMRHHTCA